MEAKLIYIGLADPESTDFDSNHQKEVDLYTTYLKSYNKTQTVCISQELFLCMHFASLLSSNLKGAQKRLSSPDIAKDLTQNHFHQDFAELPPSLSISKPSKLINFFKKDYDLIILVLDEEVFKDLGVKSITRRYEQSSYHEYQIEDDQRPSGSKIKKHAKAELLKIQESCQGSVEKVFEKFEKVKDLLLRVPEEIKIIRKSLDGKFKTKQENFLESTRKTCSESQSVLSKIENLACFVDSFYQLTQLYVLDEYCPPDLQVVIKSVRLSRSPGKMLVKLKNETHFNFKRVKLFICESQEELETITFIQKLSSVTIETKLNEEFFYNHLIAFSGNSVICDPFLIFPLKVKKDKDLTEGLKFSLLNMSQVVMTGIEIVSPESIRNLFRVDQDLHPGKSSSIILNHQPTVTTLFAIQNGRQSSNILVFNA
jgi:hypothetical protein